MYAHGWYCAAFEAELDAPLTPVTFGERRLMLWRSPAGTRAFDADCPHRGAHLAIGGRVEGDHVACPYHGHRIRLGAGTAEWSVAEYATFTAGGAVYVRLSEQEDNDWRGLIEDLAATHDVSPGLTLPLSAPMEAVIENGFDRLHFRAVHHLRVAPFEVAQSPQGALIARGRFLRAGAGVDSAIPYLATAASPGLIVVQLGGAEPYGVITGAIPTSGAGSLARLSFVLPKGSLATPEGRARHAALVDYSRRGLTDDNTIWSNLAPAAKPRWTPDDAPVERFYAFCARFEGTASSPP